MVDILGAGAGLIGGLINASNSGTAALVQMMALRNAQRNADEQLRLSEATRTDAFGNTQRYNPATNSWEIVLTPTQKAIIDAGQSEQLKSLTEDAVRNRQIKQDEFTRGQAAKQDYNTNLAGFRYDQPPSKDALTDQIYSLMSQRTQGSTSGDRQQLGRVLLRQGRGADLPAIIKAADDSAGQQLGGNLLNARNQAMQESTALTQAHQSKYLPVLDALQKTMAAGGDAPIHFSDTPQALAAQQGQQNQLTLQALQNAASNEGSAFGNLAKTIQNGFDMKGLAALVSAFSRGGSSGGKRSTLNSILGGASSPVSSAGFDDTFTNPSIDAQGGDEEGFF